MSSSRPVLDTTLICSQAHSKCAPKLTTEPCCVSLGNVGPSLMQFKWARATCYALKVFDCRSTPGGWRAPLRGPQPSAIIGPPRLPPPLRPPPLPPLLAAPAPPLPGPPAASALASPTQKALQLTGQSPHHGGVSARGMPARNRPGAAALSSRNDRQTCGTAWPRDRTSA